MQTRSLPETSDARSPAGAEIRYLMGGTTGDMIHSTVPPGQVNRATVHATVSEFWHVLSGQGEIWRRDESGEEVTVLTPGVSIDIPVGTAFQYRCAGAEALRFLCVTMPPWPGDAEATRYRGSVGADCASRPGVFRDLTLRQQSTTSGPVSLASLLNTGPPARPPLGASKDRGVATVRTRPRGPHDVVSLTR